MKTDGRQMWAESGRGKLPGNVFSSVTLWLTQNHPRSISRARRKAYATRSICSAYRVSRKGLNFHTLTQLKPSTFSHYIFEHNRSQATAAPVLPDKGSNILTGVAGELFKHQFIFDQLWTAIVHVTDRQRGATPSGGKLLMWGLPGELPVLWPLPRTPSVPSSRCWCTASGQREWARVHQLAITERVNVTSPSF